MLAFRFRRVLAVAVLLLTGSLTQAAAAAGHATQLVIMDNDFAGPGGTDMRAILPLLANRDVTVLGLTV
jgi:purine nucleosidase